MQNAVKVTGVIIAIALLLLLGLLASQVGGIAIRSVGTSQPEAQLSLSTPVVRGAPVAVYWSGINDPLSTAGVLIWKDAEREQELGTVVIGEQRGEVVFPCSTARSEGTLILVDATSRAKLAAVPAVLFPPTVECLGSE